MRIDILAIGSVGDVRPSVALGLGLQQAGHDVRIVTLGGFESLVAAYGLAHLSIAGSPGEIANTAAGREWVERRASAVGFLRGFVRIAESLIESGLGAYWPACRDAELLIVTPMGLPIGVTIAERLRSPLIRAAFAPTRHDWFERSTVVERLQGHWAVFLSDLFRLGMAALLRQATNRARRNVLALPPLPLREAFSGLDRRQVPILEAYSSTVVPPPSDWPAWIHVTGYWFLNDAPGWVPPADLADFLPAGPAPVFVGFGSTPFPNPGSATDIVVDALTRSGHRGIVVAGGSGLATGRLTRDILSVDAVPHDWLFPHVCAAVHHGGAGVTGAALRAGVPSVVVPVFADQPFWGRRVFELGAGPRPIPARRLAPELLSSAICAARGEQMQQRATALGARIRQEDGVGRAVDVIQRHAGVNALARRAS